MHSTEMSVDSLNALKLLIGRSVHSVLSPCLQAAGQHFTSPSFSISISDQTIEGWRHRYINFRCDWFEAPVFLRDYWTIHVEETKHPIGIDVNASGAIVAPCTINFYRAQPIQRIEVYRLHDRAQNESQAEEVSYDKAILFRTESGRRFCIACQLNGPGIATEVHLSEQEETILELIEGSKLRLTIS
jgi:hypothetical protein